MKPDGTILYNNCTISGNTVIYQLTNQTTASAGIVECEVTLTGSDSKQITSPRFSVNVSESLYSDDEIESEDEFTELQEAITAVGNVDISASKTGGVATVTVTDKDGDETTVTISDGAKGDTGDTGATGTTFTPSVSAEGVISWTNDGGKSNPESVSIKGPKGDKGDAGVSPTLDTYVDPTSSNGVTNAAITTYAEGRLKTPSSGLAAGKYFRIASIDVDGRPVLECVDNPAADKTDKVSNAVSGNFAGLDSNGNLTDSGKKASDFLTEHQDISGKQDKSTLEADVAAKGFTKNAGTITGITMNGSSKGTSGVVDLGTVITVHQDISGKENTSDKVTSLSASSTDTQYPSAKCVYDLVGNIESALEALL